MKDVVAPAMNNAKYGDGGTLLSEPSSLGNEGKKHLKKKQVMI